MINNTSGRNSGLSWGGSVAKLCPQPCRDMIMVGLSTERFALVDFKGSHF